MRTLIILIYLVGLFLFSFIMILVDKIRPVKSEKVHLAFQKIANHLNRLAGNHYELHGTDNLPNEPVLVVSNHESIFDPLAIEDLFGARPIAMIGKVELTKVPTLEYWSRKFGCEYIDRDDMKQSIRVIIAASKTLKSGTSICIFPEGTRNTNDEEFKAGSFKIAKNAKAPIVPITIRGTSNTFEANKPIRLKKCKPIITVHPQVNYEDYKDLDMVTLAKQMQDIVNSK